MNNDRTTELKKQSLEIFTKPIGAFGLLSTFLTVLTIIGAFRLALSSLTVSQIIFFGVPRNTLVFFGVPFGLPLPQFGVFSMLSLIFKLQCSMRISKKIDVRNVFRRWPDRIQASKFVVHRAPFARQYLGARY